MSQPEQPEVWVDEPDHEPFHTWEKVDPRQDRIEAYGTVTPPPGYEVEESGES